MHYIKARNALKELANGSEVKFVVDSIESQQKLCDSLQADGHTAIAQESEDGPIVSVVKAA